VSQARRAPTEKDSLRYTKDSQALQGTMLSSNPLLQGTLTSSSPVKVAGLDDDLDRDSSDLEPAQNSGRNNLNSGARGGSDFERQDSRNSDVDLDFDVQDTYEQQEEADKSLASPAAPQDAKNATTSTDKSIFELSK